jgi:hypothetical protein
MPSRAILTVAATAAAALGGGLASAGTVAADTAPPTTPQTGVLGIDNGVAVADNWCISPLNGAGPMGLTLPTSGWACDRKPVGDDAGVHVLDGMCVVPLTLDGVPDFGPEPGAVCDGPDPDGPVSALRDFSVAGVQVTY